jgi:hypothetical protein
MLAEEKPAFTVDRQTVGATLSAVVGRSGESRGLHEQVDARSRPPPVDAVVGNVRKE